MGESRNPHQNPHESTVSSADACGQAYVIETRPVAVPGLDQQFAGTEIKFGKTMDTCSLGALAPECHRPQSSTAAANCEIGGAIDGWCSGVVVVVAVNVKLYLIAVEQWRQPRDQRGIIAIEAFGVERVMTNHHLPGSPAGCQLPS